MWVEQVTSKIENLRRTLKQVSLPVTQTKVGIPAKVFLVYGDLI